MARPVTQQVEARQVVGTIEDQHKYQMPDDRRLRVEANPQWAMETPQDSDITRLAGALAQVKPEIMDWAVKREAGQIETEINQGKEDATMGRPRSASEHAQWGYDAVDSVNQWSKWEQEVLADYETNFDKENGNIEDFIAQKWESSGLGTKSAIWDNNFRARAEKTIQGIRTKHTEDKLKIIDARTQAAISDLIKGDLDYSEKQGIPFTVAEYEARREDIRKLFPGKTYKEVDAYVYDAVKRKAVETLNPDLLDIFKEKHSDGTPGMYSTKWEEIEKDKAAIAKLKVTKYDEDQKAFDKQWKEAAQNVEASISLQLLEIADLEGEERDKAIAAIKEQLKSAVSGNIHISEGTIDKVTTLVKKDAKLEETQAQKDFAFKLSTSGASITQINAARQRGDISHEGWKSLISEKKADQRHAEAQAKAGKKEVWNKESYKTALKFLKDQMGLPEKDFDGTPGGEQRRGNFVGIQRSFKAEVLEYMDEDGLTESEAIEKAKKSHAEIIKARGWESKNVIQAEQDIAKMKEDQKFAEYETRVKGGKPLTAAELADLKAYKIKKKREADAAAAKKAKQNKPK